MGTAPGTRRVRSTTSSRRSAEGPGPHCVTEECHGFAGALRAPGGLGGARSPPSTDMRVVYFDCPSGAAGDMILGSLVDAGVPVERLEQELRKLAVGGWRLTAREVMKRAFRATKVEVEIDESSHHPHRTLKDILGILDASTLDPGIRAR